jgi:hypothetical protein
MGIVAIEYSFKGVGECLANKLVLRTFWDYVTCVIHAFLSEFTEFPVTLVDRTLHLLN